MMISISFEWGCDMMVAPIILSSLGCLVTCATAYNIIVTIFSISLGLAYVILSFYPRSPPPNSLDLHWQQHRDFYRPRQQQNAFHATSPHQQKSFPMLERPQPAAVRNSRQDMT
ncbi:hypothetical protein BCR43DRAFT_496259 [Syncephalastrum racemosum]|uniref:Uncharacterized protein n=1 Tax=Syncephalastrum racemosum TaxID=13706 RepID=A0A1X2H3X8_SYNRA|nr:hypothetical protein BCR43DRAFT_496259 [Syncephalastrum racemosum]